MKLLFPALSFFLLLFFRAGVPVQAQDPTVLTLSPESALWVEGTSNKKKSWRANAEEMHGSVSVVDGPGAVPDLVAGRLTIRADKLTGDVATGKFIMNRLIREALKVKAHPEITYTLESAEVVPDRAPPQIQTVGTLTLAGVARPIEMTLTADRTGDGGLHLTGSYTLSMPDFDVKPPSIRTLGYHVGRDVVVHFDLTFAP